METALKQRLVGAAVLVALAVIFLPMLVQGPAPESGVSDVPLELPPTPTGQYETRDLPLVQPAPASSSGVVGMDTTAPALAGMVAEGDAATPPDAPAATLPAPVAGGDYVLDIATHPTAAAADAAVVTLRAARLPAFRESVTIDGRAVQRVRVGPYATRAEAEAVRLQAIELPAAAGARVVVLDAVPVETRPVAAAPAAKPAAAKPVAAPPATAKPVATAPAPKAPAASGNGFAVQLGAFSKPADATALRDRLRGAGFSAFTEAVSTDKGRLTRVRVGPVLDRAEADQLRAQVQSKLGIDGIVRPHP